MSLINSGFDGTVTERDFSRIMRGAGVRDSVETAAAWAVTQGTGRQVSVAPGVAYAAGVVSDSGVAILAALPTPVNGQFHLVVRRINWASNTVTVATIPHTTTTTTIPTAPPAGFPVFNDNMGVLVDQLLAWAWVRSTDTTVAVFDLRQTPISSGFLLRQTLNYTATGTFAKADYPWLRAIKVTCVGGGGGGGGGNGASTAGQGGGGGGGTATAFLTNIVGLAASVSVVVGVGGAGGAGIGGAAFNSGLTGDNSSFGAVVVAPAGPGGTPDGAAGGFGGTGDLNIGGNAGGIGGNATNNSAGHGGGSSLGGGGRGNAPFAGSLTGGPGRNFGGGGGGARVQSGAGAAGGAGAPGIVIVELYS